MNWYSLSIIIINFSHFLRLIHSCRSWSLSSPSIDDDSIIWHKYLRRKRGLTNTIHCQFLPDLGPCLLVLDEICKPCQILYKRISYKSSSSVTGIV